ncbi:hypothetical protein GCM10023082_50060 [Streptomyces tremellae]|uniref:Uncharacterized protein n=1 Tax=Streptomyces tremellae TaxID=1124239 RepID=A0ABP7FVN6_9ACTN
MAILVGVGLGGGKSEAAGAGENGAAGSSEVRSAARAAKPARIEDNVDLQFELYAVSSPGWEAGKSVRESCDNGILRSMPPARELTRH